MAAVLAAVLSLVMASAALAAERVGVIDLALVMEESRAGRQANAILQQFVAERQQALIPYEQRLEELMTRLENEAGSLSADERAALEDEFNLLAAEYLALAEQYELEVQQALATLQEQLLADIGVVLQIVAESRGFDLIIEASSAYYYRRVIDLTFEVIREYDDLWEQAQRTAGQ